MFVYNNGIIQQVDWLKMFRLLFKGTGVLIQKTDKIFIKEENYVKNLVRVLGNTPKRILSTYTIIYIYTIYT